MKKLFIFFFFVTILFAQTTNLTVALKNFCDFLYNIVGEVAILMILLSSIVYTGGQFFGAETRARANVWATNMLTGAIIGIVIIVLLPGFLAAMIGGSYSGGCNFVIP